MKHTPRPLPDIPEELRSLMAEKGPRWRDDVAGNVKLMIERFSEVLKLAPRDGVNVKTNVSYGVHERQMLDIFVPQDRAEAIPVVLFVHGGAFTSGHRNRTDQVYANVLYYLARNGIAGVNVGYRLADEARYPEATLDIGAAVTWIHAHAGEFGIDPGRLFMMAHSAGAAHAGSYAYDPRFRATEGPKLRGMIVVSGRVRVDNLPENPNARKVETYYGLNASLFNDYSPVTHIDGDSVPTLVAWAEFENPLIDVYCAELVYRIANAKRKSPPVVWLADHNHTSAIAHINTSEEILGKAIVDFVSNPGR
jgi:acetyl esterase/lipase